jgi:hypothetical protein
LTVVVSLSQRADENYDDGLETTKDDAQLIDAAIRDSETGEAGGDVASASKSSDTGDDGYKEGVCFADRRLSLGAGLPPDLSKINLEA